MELLIDPLLDTQSPDFSSIAGTCTKGQPVENVDDLFFGSELLIKTSGGLAGKQDGNQQRRGAQGA
jgi:hypothetical protein